MDRGTTIEYSNFYAILFDQPNDICPIKSAFIATIKERFRARLHENNNKDKHQNLVRAYFILNNSKNRIEYDTNKKYILDLNDYLTPQRKAEEGDLAGLQSDVEVKLVDLNQTDSYGHTALYTACRANQPEIVSWMLEHGSDPDIAQKGGSTPLHAACFYGHPKIVMLLLQSGANPALANNVKSLPYDEVFLKKKKEIGPIIKEYLQTPWGQVQFHREGNDVNLQRIMIDIQKALGTNIDKTFFYGQTLLMCAAKSGKLSIVAWLLDLGANINATDRSLRTALHFASKTGHCLVVKLLIERGANPFAIDYWQRTPFHYCSNEVLEIYKVLQPDPEIWPTFISDPTKYKLFKYLLSDDDLDRKYVNGKTLLYMAAQQGVLELVKILVERGATLETAHSLGSTPLHAACYAGQISVVKYLIALSNPFAKNGTGQTCMQEMITNETLDPQKKEELKKIFKQYEKFYSEVPIPINLVDEHNKPLTDTPFLISCNACMHELSKKIDSTWNEFKIHESTFARMDIFKPLPHMFTLGDKKLTSNPGASILDSVIKACHSAVPFFNFPITLKYTPVNPNILIQLDQIVGSYDPKLEPVYVNSMLERRFFRSRNNENILVGKFRTNGSENKIKINCTNNKYFDDIEFIFPNELKPGNLISIYLVSFNGIKYPTFEFKTERNLDKDEQCIRPSIIVKPKQSWNNFGIYTYYASQYSWIEIQSQYSDINREKNLPIIIPSMKTIITVIPKREIVPTRNTINSVHKGFHIFNELLFNKKISIDTSDPEDIKIYFKTPGSVKRNYLTVYHGTNIGFVESIVMNGLQLPKSVTIIGEEIKILQGHIKDASESKLDWVRAIPNFEKAIFLSPSFSYAAMEVYAAPFLFVNVYKGETKAKWHNAVLECLLEEGSGPGRYQKYPATTVGYIPNKQDNTAELEIRVEDPTLIHVKCLHIISQKYVHLK